MTASERGNYWIAVSVSVLFHLGLLMITIPYLPLHHASNNTIQIETIGTGLVDMPGGGGLGGGNGAFKAPSEVAPDMEVNNLKQPTTHNIVGKSNPVKLTPGQKPVPPAIRDSSKSGLTVEGKPSKGKTSEPAGSSGAAPSTGTPTNAGGNPVSRPGGTGLGDGNDLIAGMGGGSGGGIGGGTGNGIGSGSGKMRAPKSVQNEEFEGEVILRLLVKADGTMEDVVIRKPSGNDRLDNYTRNYIKREVKFKEIKEPYYIDISVDYRKNNNYIPTLRYLGAKTRP